VDRASQTGTGIHPLPPGAFATAARAGTQGRIAGPVGWVAMIGCIPWWLRSWSG